MQHLPSIGSRLCRCILIGCISNIPTKKIEPTQQNINFYGRASLIREIRQCLELWKTYYANLGSPETDPQARPSAFLGPHPFTSEGDLLDLPVYIDELIDW